MTNRLKEIRKQFGLKQDNMAKIIGISRSTYTGIENGKAQLTDRNKKSIIDILSINPLWLETGYGEMLLSPDVSRQLKEVHEIYADEIKTCNENERMLQGVSFVPLLPVSAQGGTLNDFVLSVKDFDCEQVISPMRGVDFAITVAGDSMSPEYPSGAQIFIKKINEKAFIDWGKIFVLDTCNGTVIKKILPGVQEDCVKCVSINPEYPPFEVRLKDVFGMYRVMMCMSIK